MDIPNELPSPGEMAAADAATIAAGVPALELMERAGAAVARHAERMANGSPILVLCGSGNNGGDGLVIARLLHEKGLKVQAILCSQKPPSQQFAAQVLRLKGTPLAMLDGARLEGVQKLNAQSLVEKISSAGLVVDALLGTGQKSAPSDMIAHTLKQLAHYPGAVLAVDVPTGINADTGEVYLDAIKATETVCVERVKRGMLQWPARGQCGVIRCEKIGIAVTGTEFCVINSETTQSPACRSHNAHKGLFGPVLVAAGSDLMPGAASLVSLAALRAGAGLVHCITATPTVAEIVGVELSKVDPAKYKAIVVGPGFGTSEQRYEHLRTLLAVSSAVPIVVDADALTMIAQRKELTSLRNTIITPHPGEAGRLLGCDTATIERDRYNAARALANQTKATVVLKGAGTIVYRDGHGWVQPSANPWMATAGSGDVLAGIIAAMLVQGLGAEQAAVAAVHMHARCGDVASDCGRHPLIATDLVDAIPLAWESMWPQLKQ